MIKTFDDRLAIVIGSFFEVFEFSGTGNEIFSLKNPEATDHENSIVTIDFDQKNCLILTAGLDNRVLIGTPHVS